MNIMFLTLIDIRSADQRNIYSDLLRALARQGHAVYVVSPAERRCGLRTCLYTDRDPESGVQIHILKVKTGNIQKTNLIEKGISTLRLEGQVNKAVGKYLKDVKFDLVIYSTPPITLYKAIRYVKKRDGAKSYLLLKDIFPQNAVDMGMMTKSGLKGILYKMFRKKETKLYAISDRIGCMSQANVDYLLKHNPEVDPKKVEICPNAVEISDMSVDAATRQALREKYNIPLDKKVFVYGGNLGRPQGVPFIMQCLEKMKNDPQAYFLIVGDGTEYKKLRSWFDANKPPNMQLLAKLPKEDYDRLVGACDVGLIFLDHRFTIPNFPSRLLSYMQAKLPVLCCTDPNTDVGKTCVEGDFGWDCRSNNAEAFRTAIDAALVADLQTMGQNGFACLQENYSVEAAAKTVLK